MADETPIPARASGPTPEEISARLEALLKRTHALRQARQTREASGDTEPTWPPSDHDMAAVEVVDVPPTSMLRGADARQDDARPPDRAEGAVPGSDVAPTSGEALASSSIVEAQPPVERADATSEASAFGRPDWSTLRLRDAPVEAPATPAWVWLLIAALVVALGAETAYLLRTQPWAESRGAAAGPGVSLRFEGDEATRVRVGDDAPRSLPFDQAVTGEAVRIAILPPGAEPPASTASASAPASSSPAAPDIPADAVTATTGAVFIQSTPAGAIVTMEGRERGPTPITIPRLRPGRHDVLVTSPAGRLALKVDVTAGEVTRLDASRTAR